jgi:hypothetical protein
MADELRSWPEVSGHRVIVSMIQFNDQVLVATADNIYAIRDGKIEVVRFVVRDAADAD